MKKIIALALLLSASSAYAHLGGMPVVPQQLVKSWNGEAGIQQSNTMGVRVQWFADEKGNIIPQPSLPPCSAIPAGEPAFVNKDCFMYAPQGGGGGR